MGTPALERTSGGIIAKVVDACEQHEKKYAVIWYRALVLSFGVELWC